MDEFRRELGLKNVGTRKFCWMLVQKTLLPGVVQIYLLLQVFYHLIPGTSDQCRTVGKNNQKVA